MYKTHIHSDFSNIRLLDSINTIEGIAKRCSEIGALGFILTDHECVSGSIKAQQLKKKYPNLKVGLGNEIYLVNERGSGQKYYHYILIAKNGLGHKAIRELSSIAWINSYTDRGMTRVPTLKSELAQIVAKYPNSLIATSACLGGELSSLTLELIKFETMENEVEVYKIKEQIYDFIKYSLELFGKDFYIECAPNDIEPQISVNKRLKKIADGFGIKMIYGDDAHFLSKQDAPIHKAYLNSKDGEREVEQFYKTAYIQERDEVYDYLSHSFEKEFIDELFMNNEEIFSKLEDYSLFKKSQIPEVKVEIYPKTTDESSIIASKPILQSLRLSDIVQERYWVNMCLEALDKKIEDGLVKRDDLEKYLDRLETEADIVKYIGDQLDQCLFAYFNTFQHYIDLFWECGSIVGPGRGSATGFLSNYLLGITQLDPIQWGLPEWRFLNKDRAELPKLYWAIVKKECEPRSRVCA